MNFNVMSSGLWGAYSALRDVLFLPSLARLHRMCTALKAVPECIAMKG